MASARNIGRLYSPQPELVKTSNLEDLGPGVQSIAVTVPPVT